MRVNKNLITTILFQLINIVYGLILPRTIIVNFGSEINGLIASSLYIVGYMKIVEAGLSTASIKQFYKPLASKNMMEINNLFQSINVYFKKISNVYLGVAFIAAIFYAIASNSSFTESEVFILFMVISLTAFLDFKYNSKYYVYFLANQSIYKFQLTQIFAQLLKIISVIWLSSIELNITLLMLILSSITIVKTILLKFFIIKENLGLTNEFEKRKIYQKNSVLTHQILGLILYNTPVILISILLGANQASIFSIYLLVFGTFYGFFSMVFNQIVTPKLGHIISTNNYGGLEKLFNRYLKISSTILFLFSTTTIIMFEPFIKIYTQGADINYYYYELSVFFVIYIFFNSQKIPYQSLINANGDFKKTLVYSYGEVAIFLTVLLFVFKYSSVTVFILALLFSSLYKFNRLKHYVTKNIIKDNLKRKYVDITYFLILLLFSIPKYEFINENITNILEWIFISLCVFIAATLFAGMILFSEKIINNIKYKSF